MIKLTPFSTSTDPRDTQVENTIIREVADLEIVGYISAVNCAVAAKVDYFQILPVDLVISKLPPVLAGRGFKFTYKNGLRLASRIGWGFGRFAHVHLSTTLDVSYFRELVGCRVKIVGTEIALQRDGRVFCWGTRQMADLLRLPAESELRADLLRIEQHNIRAERSGCHFVFVHSIDPSPLLRLPGPGIRSAAGEKAIGHFVAATAAGGAAMKQVAPNIGGPGGGGDGGGGAPGAHSLRAGSNMASPGFAKVAQKANEQANLIRKKAGD